MGSSGALIQQTFHLGQTGLLALSRSRIWGLLVLAATAANLVFAPPVLAQNTAAHATAIPIDSFSSLPFLHNPTLSPDGKKIAVLVTTKEKKFIGIIDLTAPAGSDLKYYAIGKGGINWFRWAGNSQLLMSFGNVRSLLFFVMSSNVLKRLDLETSDVLSLNESSELAKDQIIFHDPYGRYILVYQYRDGKPFAVRINLKDGSEVVVQKPRHRIDQWLADATGHIRAGVDYSQKRWRLYYRDQPGGKLIKTEKRRYDSFEDGVVEDFHFLPETGQAIILTNSKTGRFGAYHYNIGEDLIGETIYEHPSADVTRLVMDANQQIVGVEFDAEKPGQKWLNADLQDLYLRINRVFKTKNNRILGTSVDRKVALFWSGSGSDPGSYFLFHPEQNKIEQVLIPFEKIDPDQMAEMKPVRYASRDGHQVPAYLTRPKDSEDAALPTIIMPHGGPFSRTSWQFDPWVQLLVNRGYVVLQPNFRGSTGYGRDYVEKGYDQWGTGMIDDIDDGVTWLVEQGIADPEKVCIMGASYGGYAALWGAIRKPDMYRCAISLNGVTDVRAMLKYDRKQFAARRYARKWEERVAGEEKKDLEAISPVQQAARLRVPVLIAQGKKDTNVPPEQADALIKALTKAGNTQWDKIYFPKSGHEFVNSEDSTNFLKKALQFLARHNPTPANADSQAEDLKITVTPPPSDDAKKPD